MLNKQKIQGHIPNKGLGQNFLQDAYVIAKIVQAIAPKTTDRIIEIGPGLGALTHELLKHLKTLAVIEIDSKLAKKWQAYENVDWLAADALLFDLKEYAQRLNLPQDQQDQQSLSSPLLFKIIGNLPYHISSPLLFHYLKFKSQISQQCFMLQKEVIDRILAKHSEKDYGRLSIILQANYQMYRVLDVPPEAFFPPPRVHSSVISMQPRAIIIHQKTLNDLEEVKFNEILARVTQICFSQRRKMLRAMFKNQAEDLWAQKIQSICQSLEIDLSLRPENLSLDDYLKITTIIYQNNKSKVLN